ncbi:hypothetical protein, partial [Amycolatopsis lurida]|uniref:hypothetical protein n=1 Tax=Amycolatopsis lurida TaxID=31959 RepID=UPI0036472CCE
ARGAGRGGGRRAVRAVGGALKRGIPKLAYLPDGRLVDEHSDEWPFASAALTGNLPSVPPRVLRASTRGRHRISGSS